MNSREIEMIVRTRPGTATGILLRRYWIPVVLASEIPIPDCPPVRVRVLGEKLLAFRDSQGRPGLVDEFCAHRGTSLFFGRNEHCGIRCSFHGWKYDITGRCVELPSQPELAPKIRIKAYTCVELGDIVWAYMGPPELCPGVPQIEWALVPPTHRFVSKRLQECNYLQAIEGGIDALDASWVHRYGLDIDPLHHSVRANKYIQADCLPVFELEETPFGLSIFARRVGEQASYYWRVSQWIFPWFILFPPLGPHPLEAKIWVPLDDENCWVWSINFYPDKALSEEERAAMREGKGTHVECIPGTFRPKANRDNDYLIDREAQKQGRLVSGVAGFAMQVASLEESMGPIQDRSRENLVMTDAPVTHIRRILFDTVFDAVHGLKRRKNTELPGLMGSTQRVRAGSVLLDRSINVRSWAREALVASDRTPVHTV